MTRTWAILTAAISVFLIYSLAVYFQESSKLHKGIPAADDPVAGGAVRSSSAGIDETWLAGELPRLKAPEQAGPAASPVETTATITP